MAILNFPSDTTQSPYVENGVTYTWTGEYWEATVPGAGGGGTGSSIIISETPPNNPQSGDLWYNSSEDSGRLFVYYVEPDYNDGVGPGTAQWVDASPATEQDDESASVRVSATPPSGPSEGDLWWNTDDGRLYIYYIEADYNDGSGPGTAQWVDASPEGSGIDDGGANCTISETPPSPAEDGDLWWDSVSTNLFIYYDDGDSQQWVEASPGGGGGAGEGEPFPEAPLDGQQYARQNANWSVVQAGDNNTTIDYQGAAAWGSLAADGSLTKGMNIASSIKTGTGQYTVTFTNAMPSDDYAVVLGCNAVNVRWTSKSTTQITFQSQDQSNVAVDKPIDFAVHALNALPPQGGTGTDAWGDVNADGTLAAGFNCTTANTATGEVTVTFTNPMPSANYAVTLGGGAARSSIRQNTKTANSFEILTFNSSDAATDIQVSFSVNATNATLPLTITEDQIAALIQNPVLSAWGDVNADGTVNNSFNLARNTVSRPLTGSFDIEFATPMPNNDYSVTVGGASLNIIVENKTTTGFRVTTHDGANNNDWLAFSFQVAGTARNGTLGGGADAWGTVAADGTLNNGLNCTTVRNSTGKYTVTFANPMPNDNYAVVASIHFNSTSGSTKLISYHSKTVNGFEVTTKSTSDFQDHPFSFAVFATDGNAGGFWVREGEGSDEVLKPLNNDATIEASALTDGITTKTMTEVLAGGGGSGGGGDTIINYNGAAAWANCDATGVTANGAAVTVTAGLNIDSVTKISADGSYLVRFTNQMPNANYAVVGTADNSANATLFIVSDADKTPTQFIVRTAYPSTNSLENANHFYFAVHALNALPPQWWYGY